MSPRPTAFTDALRNYLLNVTVEDSALLAELREKTAQHPHGRMQVAQEQGQLIRFLVELTGATRCLEIGVFTGYSALCAAYALPEHGLVVGIDRNSQTTQVAREFFTRAGMEHKLELRIGTALDELSKLKQQSPQPFDFAFIDADKENLIPYYEHCLELVRPGGVIGADNVFWGGAVIDESDVSEGTVAVRNFNRHVASDPRVRCCMLPLGDGVLLAYKR